MKPNLTVDYLRQLKPTSRLIDLGPISPPPPNRQPMARLAWQDREEAITYDSLAWLIGCSSLPTCVFFIDTCLLTDHEVPKPVWDALRTRRVAITPHILYELRDWIETPSYNRPFCDEVRLAVAGRSKWVRLISPSVFSFNARQAATYYISLLGLRKRYPSMVRAKLVEQGKPFTDADVQRICQKDLQDRGWRLAKKAMADTAKPNFLADEELVVWAILHGLFTGHETIILTRDPDVLEQFYKALYMLDTHYHSMLIADEYSLHPWTFSTKRLDESLEWMREAFSGDDDCLIRLPKHFEVACLPPSPRPVTLDCWLLRGQPPSLHCSGLAFNAEVQMRNVLDVKAVTGGLNTCRLGGRNCHVCPAPKHQDMFGGWGIISTDVQLRWGDTKISVVDANLSILRIEKKMQVLPMPLPPLA